MAAKHMSVGMVDDRRSVIVLLHSIDPFRGRSLGAFNTASSHEPNFEHMEFVSVS